MRMYRWEIPLTTRHRQRGDQKHGSAPLETSLYCLYIALPRFGLVCQQKMYIAASHVLWIDRRIVQ